MLAHLTVVADTTDLPVMLYDIPGRTGLALSHDTLLELAGHPQIVAVKDAKDDLAATSRLLAACDLAVYSGSDQLNLPLLAIGAVGMVSVVGHLVTPQLVDLITAYAAGDVTRAREVHLRLQPVITGIFRTQGVILTKAALALLGTPVGPVRLPLVEATPQERAVLSADLIAGGLTLA